MASKLNITCKQATLLALKQEDKKLGFLNKVALWYHLSICKACKFFKIQSAFISKQAMLGEVNEVYVLREEVKEKMEQHFQEMKQR